MYVKKAESDLDSPLVTKYFYASDIKSCIPRLIKVLKELINATWAAIFAGKEEIVLKQLQFADGQTVDVKAYLTQDFHQLHVGISSDPAIKKAIKKFSSDSEQAFQIDCAKKLPGAIEFLNGALGNKFHETYLANGKGSWCIFRPEEERYDGKLHGQYSFINKETDCQWFKAKLIKAGVSEEDIHFDLAPGNKTHTIRYQLRVSNLQKIITPTPSSSPSDACHSMRSVKK